MQLTGRSRRLRKSDVAVVKAVEGTDRAPAANKSFPSVGRG
jgi:hypothetical protein